MALSAQPLRSSDHIEALASSFIPRESAPEITSQLKQSVAAQYRDGLSGRRGTTPMRFRAIFTKQLSSISYTIAGRIEFYIG